MHTPTRTTRFTGSRQHRGAGFSLMEVMVAMGIFTVGLVAVAAVFPTAITIQRETVRDLAGQRVTANAKAMVFALAQTKDPVVGPNRFRELTYLHNINPAMATGTLVPYLDLKPPYDQLPTADNPNPVLPLVNDPPLPFGPPQLLAPQRQTGLLQASFHDLFTLDMRSHPSNIQDVSRRDYYWYPLIQANRLNPSVPPTWRAHIMVMRRTGSEAPPQVRLAEVDLSNTSGSIIELKASASINAAFDFENDIENDGLPDLIQPGDQILDTDGNTHRIILVDRNILTVDSPNVGKPVGVYYAVAIDLTAPNVPKRETRSPIVRIDLVNLVVRQP